MSEQNMEQQGSRQKLERGAEMIARILELAGLELEIETAADDGAGRILLKGPDSWAISGQYEEVTTALQHLVSCVLSGPGESDGPTVESALRDSGRDAQLDGLAADLGALVRSSGRAVAVDLMTEADRKALHRGLTEAGDLETQGVGDGAYRRLVVRPHK